MNSIVLFWQSAVIAFSSGDIDLGKMFVANILNFVALLGIPFFAVTTEGRAKKWLVAASVLAIGFFFPFSIMQSAINEHQSKVNTEKLVHNLVSEIEKHGIEKKYFQINNDTDYLISNTEIFKKAVSEGHWFQYFGQGLITSLLIKPLIVTSSNSVSENSKNDINSLSKETKNKSDEIKNEITVLNTKVEQIIAKLPTNSGSAETDIDTISVNVEAAKRDITALNASVGDVTASLQRLEESFKESQLRYFVTRFDRTTAILQSSEARYNALSHYVTCLKGLSFWKKMFKDEQCDVERQKLEELNSLVAPIEQTAQLTPAL